MAHTLTFEVCPVAAFKIEVSTSMQCSPTEAKLINGLQKDETVTALRPLCSS